MNTTLVRSQSVPGPEAAERIGKASKLGTNTTHPHILPGGRAEDPTSWVSLDRLFLSFSQLTAFIDFKSFQRQVCDEGDNGFSSESFTYN